MKKIIYNDEYNLNQHPRNFEVTRVNRRVVSKKEVRPDPNIKEAEMNHEYGNLILTDDD